MQRFMYFMLFSISLWSHNAFAETDIEKAKRLYQNGQELYDEGNYDAAILAWNEGYVLSNKAGFLKNIALAYEAKGEYEEALAKLNEYRAFAPLEEKEALKEHSLVLSQKIQEEEANQLAKIEQERQLEDRLKMQTEKSNGDLRSFEPSSTGTNVTIDSTVNSGTIPEPTLPKTPLLPKSVWLTTATITGVSATALTLAALGPYNDLKSLCDTSSNLCLPTESMASDDYPWDKLMLYRNLSLGLWGATILTSSIGLTQNTSIQMTPNAILLQGGF